MWSLGIIQGRLSPMVNSQIQSFPGQGWDLEFELAANIGYEAIEWVLDAASVDNNPLLSDSGRRDINSVRNSTGIEVASVCCDFFMEHPLHLPLLEAYPARGLLLELCRISREVGINKIEIPLIGPSSVRALSDRDEFYSLLDLIYPILLKNDLILLLETDLNVDETKKFLDGVDTELVKINYDMGNSAFWGFNSSDEITGYGSHIGNVHIKDCTPDLYSVELGQGNVDFETVFSSLREIGFRGEFIVQGARFEDNFATAERHKKFSQKCIEKYLKKYV